MPSETESGEIYCFYLIVLFLFPPTFTLRQLQLCVPFTCVCVPRQQRAISALRSVPVVLAVPGHGEWTDRYLCKETKI